MKFVNGKLLGRKRALTTLPGIGQIYALRLEAVGFKKPVDLLNKYNQLNGDENHFKKWLKTSCRVWSHHADKCLNGLKTMHVIGSSDSRFPGHPQWITVTLEHSGIFHFRLQHQRSAFNDDAILSNVTQGALVTLPPISCNNDFHGESKPNQLWDDIEKQPSNIEIGNKDANPDKWQTLPDGDTLEPNDEFHMKFETTINEANKKLHELQSDLDNMKILHREYRAKTGAHELKHQHELQSIWKKVNNIDVNLNKVSSNVDRIVRVQTKLDHTLFGLNGQIKLPSSSNDAFNRQVRSFQNQMNKTDAVLEQVVDRTTNLEYVVHREFLQYSDKIDQVVGDAFDKKFGEIQEELGGYQRSSNIKLSAISLSAALLICCIYLRKI